MNAPSALAALLAHAVRLAPWPLAATPAASPASGAPAAPSAAPPAEPRPPAAASARQPEVRRAALPSAGAPAVLLHATAPARRLAVAPDLEALYRRDDEGRPAAEAARGDRSPSDATVPGFSPREIERLMREHGEPQGRTIALGALFPPDAGATLCIRREERKPPAGAAPPTHLWSARLQLSLPRLGEVALVVSVHEELARVSARAASAASRAELAAGAPLLAAALERNALVLERIEVAADDA